MIEETRTDTDFLPRRTRTTQTSCHGLTLKQQRRECGGRRVKLSHELTRKKQDLRCKEQGHKSTRAHEHKSIRA